MQTISELVKAQKAASDLTYEALAQRAQKVGFVLTKQQLSDLANNRPKGWPKSAEMVQALSVALNVPERTVVLAYAKSFGIDVSETRSPFEVRLPATVSSLAPSMQDAILHVIRAATEGATQDEHDAEDEQQEPRTEARRQEPAQSSPMFRAGVSPAEVTEVDEFSRRLREQRERSVTTRSAPLQDREDLGYAADDTPSEGRALRERQDESAEGSQDTDEWGGA